MTDKCQDKPYQKKLFIPLKTIFRVFRVGRETTDRNGIAKSDIENPDSLKMNTIFFIDISKVV